MSLQVQGIWLGVRLAVSDNHFASPLIVKQRCCLLSNRCLVNSVGVCSPVVIWPIASPKTSSVPVHTSALYPSRYSCWSSVYFQVARPTTSPPLAVPPLAAPAHLFMKPCLPLTQPATPGTPILCFSHFLPQAVSSPVVGTRLVLCKFRATLPGLCLVSQAGQDVTES